MTTGLLNKGIVDPREENAAKRHGGTTKPILGNPILGRLVLGRLVLGRLVLGRSVLGTLVLVALALSAPVLVSPARAQQQDGSAKVESNAKVDAAGGAHACDTPAYLLATDSVLGKVADKIRSDRTLDVLVVGSGSSTLSGPDGVALAYPARLEAHLSKALDGVSVHVSTDIHPKQTAEEVGEGLEKTVNERKPTLVIWQTGTVDALHSVDPDDFRTAIKDGVGALRKGGASVILMNPQYNPRMETMVSVTAYLDSMRVVAQELDVPLFDRFSIMRHWTDAGNFDLSITTHTLALAKSVHDCLGHALANLVVEASRVNPVELRIQR